MSGNYKEFKKVELLKPHLFLTAELVHLLPLHKVYLLFDKLAVISPYTGVYESWPGGEYKEGGTLKLVITEVSC